MTSLTVAGGDSFGGATPPISNFFGDKPTVQIMRYDRLRRRGGGQPASTAARSTSARS